MDRGLSALATDPASAAARFFAWSTLAITAVYIINVALTYWAGWPGAVTAYGPDWNGLALLQAALVPIGLLAAAALIHQRPTVDLRAEAALISAGNASFIRACFWAVVLIGLAEGVVAFLRLEGWFALIAGETADNLMSKQTTRALYLHTPLILVACVVAARRSAPGFYWLALFVVVAELLIVIARAIFTFEQTYMSDLARFWYSALFLLASANTLLEEGHVRVDFLYSSWSRRRRGWVDAVGAVLLGLVTAWTILGVGAWGLASPIVGPLLDVERNDSQYGAYVKYLLAGLLGVFAVSMIGQFLAQFLNAVADIRDGGEGDDGGAQRPRPSPP